MDNSKKFRDNYNKFIMHHRKLVIVARRILYIAIFMALVILSKIIVGEQINSILSNSEFVVLLASALGAITGGVITYLINIRTMFTSNHMKASIINKKVIYEPLLLDFKNLHNELNVGKVIHFAYDADFRTIGSTLFDAWRRIKQDSRYYQMPDYYRKECLDVESKINNYEQCKTQMINTVYDVFDSVLKNYKYRIEENEGRIKSFIRIDNVLNNQNFAEYVFSERQIKGIPKVTQKDIQPIVKEYEEQFMETNVIAEYNKSKDNLIESLNIVINSTETIIIRIADVYEKRNSLL